MKKYLLTLVFSIFFVAAYTQTSYYVSKVNGKIFKAGGKLIKAGDKLTQKDKISFSNKTDLLILLNPAEGRFTISPDFATSSKEPSLTGIIKDFLQLSAKVERLSAGSAKPKSTTPKHYKNKRDSIEDLMRMRLRSSY